MVAKTPKKSKAHGRPLISKEAEALAVKDGKVAKAKNGSNPKPVSKKKQEAIKAARMALATGKIASDEKERRLASDLRTLYVRFKAEVPSDEGQVRQRLDNHPEIKFIRIPRQNQKNIRYVFVEFGSEAQCEKAKELLTTGPKAKDGLYIDYVGVKSKQGGKPAAAAEKGKRGKRPINPTRLFIKGLVEGLTEEKLKQLFPKAIQTSIPKMAVRKGSKFGYVQFENPADAKAAFDASQKLTISAQGSGTEGHHMTVTYAQQSKRAVKAAKQQSSKAKSTGAGNEGSAKGQRKKADKKTKKDVKKDTKAEEVVKDEETETQEKESETQDEETESKEDAKVGDKNDSEEDSEDGNAEADEEKGDGGDDDNKDAEEDGDEDEDDDDDDDEDEDMENDAESSEEEEG